MKKIMLTFFILTSILVITACSPSNKYDIVVTDYFTHDIVKQITGDTLSIKMLQPINVDYHSYQPNSRDLVDLKRSELFIFISVIHSPWLVSETQVSDLLGHDRFISFETLLGLENHHHDDHDDEDDHGNDEHEHDEHDDHDHDHGFDFISNPFYVLTIIDNLTHYLADMFPEYSDLFETNGHNYYDALYDLVNEVSTARKANDPQVIYFVGHNALAGFSEAFNLDIRALDENVSPNSVASSVEVANFITKLKEENISLIFVEEVYNISTVAYIASQVPGLRVLELHTFHKISVEDYNQGIGYLDLIQRNINNLEMIG
jgi:zinc transport system substrate-binding protein